MRDRKTVPFEKMNTFLLEFFGVESSRESKDKWNLKPSYQNFSN